ncbi:Aldehyde dehydrogenase [Pseudonocardia sp. Ae263_Ps1]|nr:Aldehyde dehydrogenase [Pseudonocardia sp. Ae150A_Ps1]OLL88511.1 Aldehyde dehydrogenase [Pseudonocardia sp. Ae263_Ps1]OLL91466.1 Aldehyde dehydrogenase [Pseudonocardia sp. Ae356_Ps1]
MTTSLDEFGLFVGGKSVGARSGRTFESQNPYTGAPWAQLADGGPDDVDEAVAAARAALDGEWGAMTGFARAAVLRRCGDAIAANAERLARLEVNDSGKLLREMRGQLQSLPQWYYYFSGLADKIEGRTVPPVNPNYFGYTLRELVGVVGAITPWNSPLLLLTFKLGPRARGRLHDGGQAVRALPRLDRRVRRGAARGRAAGRCAERRDRLGPRLRRGAGEPPGDRQGRLHRIHRHRRQGRRGGSPQRQPGHPGAGRQVPAGRVPGRRPRRRRERPGRRRVRGHRPDLHGRVPPDRPRRRPRRAGREGRRAGRRDRAR